MEKTLTDLLSCLWSKRLAEARRQEQDWFYLSYPCKTKAQSSPQKARSAIAFQKVWQPFSLHAKVLANLVIPAIYSSQTVNHTIEKVHHQNQTLLGSEEYSQGFLLRCHYNSMLFLILFFGFCPTQNSQVTGGPEQCPDV